MRDGARLAALHLWPIDLDETAPTVIVRSPYGVAGGRSSIGMVGRLIAESGYHVILQDVRGRYRSEGLFEPFVNERSDGGDTLDWVAGQSWCDGRIGLFGGSYHAYTAWAALAEQPARVNALAVAIGSSDLYPLFYEGGAFALSVALEWGLGVGERESVPRGHVDLERGLAFRPTREADRVALRTVDWVRDWIDHPRKDEYWQRLDHTPPPTAPPTLLLSGWYDFFLTAELDDFAKLAAAARGGQHPHPRLVVGPWSHGMPARLAWWRHGFFGNVLRNTVEHFDVHLRGEPDVRPKEPVRYFLAGSNEWRTASCWPPLETELRRLHIRARSNDAAPSPDTRGALDWGVPEADEEADVYLHDPDDPVPTVGGALFGLKSGAKDQGRLARRADVLTYDTATLDEALTIAGPVRLELFVSCDADDVDFTAKLVDVAPNGRALNLCDGIVRCRWRNAEASTTEPELLSPGEVTRARIELGSTAAVIGVGHRLRLQIASTNFPRFDRNPGNPMEPALCKPTDCRTSRQTIFHDAERPSHLEISILTG